jgi:hypothetical protein
MCVRHRLTSCLLSRIYSPQYQQTTKEIRLQLW